MDSNDQSPARAQSSEDLEPAAKRRRLDADPLSHRASRHYENTTAQGHSRNVYGDITYNVYPKERAAGNPPAEASGEDEDIAASLKEALAFEQMDARLDTISKAHAKTCQWLFVREEYKTWRDPEALRTHNGFFWIKGKPGAGKSTLMKSALHHGEKAHKDVGISFFFNARGEQLQQSLEGMYRSLLYQLLDQIPRLANALPRRREQANRQEWHVEVLKDMFEAAILALGSTQVTCYIDALDECDDSEARAMAESFEVFGQSAVEAQIGFRVLLSSRRYPHITIEHCLELDLEGQEGHEADIADYVRCKLKIGKSKLANEIRSAIQARASGIFLWVVLVIRILNECNARGKTHLLKKRLETIPDGLSELFNEILRRGTHSSDDILLTFQWILFARRPLKREELYFAIATKSSDDNIEAWNPDEITPDDMERFLLDSSKGLAEMTRGKHPTVQFIHESVKEYLLNDGLATLEPSLLENSSESSHDRLKQCCYQYLRKSEAALLPLSTDGMKESMPKNRSSMKVLRDSVAATHPFTTYALEGVTYHADLAHSPTHPQNAFVAEFPLKLWRRIYNTTRVHHTRRLSDNSESLYTFVLTGTVNLASIEIQKTPSQVTKPLGSEYHRFLVGAAVDNGDYRMMRMLLHHGADVNSIAIGTSSTCLLLAIQRRDASLVQFLIDAGADPTHDIKVRNQSHQIYAFSHISDQDVIKTILKREPYSRPNYWSADLSAVLDYARSKHYKVVEGLLFERLDAIATGMAASDDESITQNHGHSFVAACSHGKLALVGVLLRRGILEVLNNAHLALAVAARNGQLSIVRELLDNGVEVDLVLHHEHTALTLATLRDHEEIVKLLFDRGADVNHRNSHRSTALHLAAVYSHVNILQMLLNFGADPNVLGARFYHHPPECRSPLHIASAQGNERIVRILLCHVDTDVDLLSEYGHHAIYFATKVDSLRCVQALLETVIPPEHLQKALELPRNPGCIGPYLDRDEIVALLLARLSSCGSAPSQA